MKRKNMKQVLAAVMSAAMVMGMPMAALAEPAESPDQGVANAPIYSFDVTTVVVPTSMKVAFNPDELKVKVDANVATAGESTAQVLSQNFAIVNKANRDKIATVTFQVEDLNGNKITFVDTDTEATNAEEGVYAMYLAMLPAATGTIETSAGAIDDDTTAADLGNVKMTSAAATTAVTLKSGDNDVAFVLEKATYKAVSGSELDLSTGASNSVGSNFEIDALGTKGITAFTFTGALNKKADWSKLTSAVKITAVYSFKTTYDYDDLTDADNGSVVSGTGAMLSGLAPSIATTDLAILESGKDVNISVNFGIGDLKATKVTSVAVGGVNKLGGSSYSYADGVITISASAVNWFIANPNTPIEITFDDTAKTKLTVILTVKPETN